LCEAIAVFSLLIIGLYFWTVSIGIETDSQFYVSSLAAMISGGALMLSALSYFVVPESLRTVVVYAAYWVLLFATGAVTLTTGVTSSPFIALWMIAAIFSGIFGQVTVSLLFITINALAAFIAIGGHMTHDLLLGTIMAGELPLIVSYILWHGKSSSEKTRERAYYDLENELEAAATKSEVVINAINDGVIAINAKGEIALINPAALRLVGWKHEDALGLDYKSVLQLLAKDGKEIERATDPILIVLSTNTPSKHEDFQLQTSSGKKVTIELVASPIGQVGSGAIIVFSDVTKQREDEKSQTEFISTASHEMRTPVASIEGYLGLALNPATATIDEKAREFITKAHEAAEHLGHLFQDLLDVTKADDRRLSNNPKVIDVVNYTDDIIGGLRPKAEQKNLKLFFKAAQDNQGGLVHTVEPIYFVNVDSDHLREVLNNLIENAIKYTPEGEVVVDVKGDETKVVVSITDSGIGIPAEDIPHLFQKFYRVDNSDTREIGGTGLGLYLCRRLIESMGGRIWVDSEYKKGSTFSIELARLSNQEANRLIEASDTSAKGTASINELRTYELGKDKSVVKPSASMSVNDISQVLSTKIIMEHAEPGAPKTPAVPAPAVKPELAPAATPKAAPAPVAAKPAASAPATPVAAPGRSERLMTHIPSRSAPSVHAAPKPAAPTSTSSPKGTPWVTPVLPPHTPIPPAAAPAVPAPATKTPALAVKEN
jgi:PAS domain S-box-containing protein